ncbi:MAG: sulfatase/phosphatase domain-containing protein, partial [Planctomycetota bacterium]
FTSDNGGKQQAGARNGGLRGGKASFYDGGLRVPTVMRWPGVIEAGAVVGTPLTFFDFFPTYCDLLGSERPADRDFDGCSLLPILTGGRVERSALPLWIGRHHAVVREGEWKLLARFERFRPGQTLTEYFKTRRPASFELYNLKDDPKERHDLSDRSPDKLRSLSQVLQSRLTGVQAEIVTWGGRNVVPEKAARNLGGRFPAGSWKTLSAERQEYLGHER